MPAVPDREAFVELCAAVIGLSRLGPDDNFFEAGGDSLAAARLSVLADDRWQLHLDIFDIIGADTIGQIHQRLVGEGAETS